MKWAIKLRDWINKGKKVHTKNYCKLLYWFAYILGNIVGITIFVSFQKIFFGG